MMSKAHYDWFLTRLREYLPKSYAMLLSEQLAKTEYISSSMFLGDRTHQQQVIDIIAQEFGERIATFPLRTGSKDLKTIISKQYIKNHDKIFVIPDISYVTNGGQKWLTHFLRTKRLDNGVFHTKAKGLKLIFLTMFNDKASLDKAESIPKIANQLYLERRLRKVATLRTDLINSIGSYINFNKESK